MRKLVIILLCVLLAWCTYQTIAVGFSMGTSISVANYTEIAESSRRIDSLISELANVNDVQFPNSQESLASAIKKYKNTKEEYESLIDALNSIDENSPDVSLVDTYDVDFLWTIIGNYGTEEGITLRFNVVKSANALVQSKSYLMCDLKFTVSGDYIPITDFIYDLEDDSRLAFEISDFSMARGGENLQATFTVKNVPINNKNLTELSNYVSPSTAVDEYGNPVSTATNDNSSSSNNNNKTN